MGRIAILNDALVNKIAAGEVVERPASVVKELCENSLDARATTLRVTLQEGGLSLVQVADDGQGMSREDASLSLERHATSKLSSLEGLFKITTQGFRGEALPAIASVCRFTLTTSEPGAAVGTRVRVEGGGSRVVEEAAPPGGTVVRVEDLFFNTPARRKFLRRADTEFKHAQEAVLRLALAHPEVAFHLEHGGRSLLSCGACPDDPRERIVAALGAEVYPHLLPVEERRLGVLVRGHVASPELNFSTLRGLYTFVNRRYIRDRGLISVVQRAFADTLPPGRQPVAVLFIEIDPRAVDVNVHPQKLEVRFADARSVYDAVHGALSRALKSAPWQVTEPVLPRAAEPAAHYAQAVDRFLSRAQAQDAGWGSALPPPPPETGPALPSRAPAFGQARPSINEAPPPGYFSSLRWLGTLGKRFWVCEGPGGTLVVLDPHAAVERARLSSFHRQLVAGGPASGQQALFSSAVELSLGEASAVLERREGLSRLGLEVEPFGGGTVALKALPSALAAVDLARLLSDLSGALPPDGGDAGEAAFGPALKLMACHAATQADYAPAHAALAALLRELDDADFHLPCLHSRVVVLEVPLLELEGRARESLPGKVSAAAERK